MLLIKQLTAIFFLWTSICTPPSENSSVPNYKNKNCIGSIHCKVCSNCTKCSYCNNKKACGVCNSQKKKSGTYSSTHKNAPLIKRSIIKKIFTGKVVGVSDGDSFTLLMSDNTQIKIRLQGIDCPEKKQDYGQVAKKFISNLIFNKTVTVLRKNTDRYGRIVGIILLTKGMNVNEELLKAGLAWHYTQHDNNRNWDSLELAARLAKRGLWSKNNVIPPWEWRKVKH